MPAQVLGVDLLPGDGEEEQAVVGVAGQLGASLCEVALARSRSPSGVLRSGTAMIRSTSATLSTARGRRWQEHGSSRPAAGSCRTTRRRTATMQSELPGDSTPLLLGLRG